jgi:hypothetical protein
LFCLHCGVVDGTESLMVIVCDRQEFPGIEIAVGMMQELGIGVWCELP